MSDYTAGPGDFTPRNPDPDDLAIALAEDIADAMALGLTLDELIADGRITRDAARLLFPEVSR